MMKIKILNNILFVDNLEVYSFIFDIKDFIVLDERIVVLINSPTKSLFNENIFCIDKNGQLIWQVEKVVHIYEDSPYDKIVNCNNESIEAWNCDSCNYLINIQNGKIISRRFTK